MISKSYVKIKSLYNKIATPIWMETYNDPNTSSEDNLGIGYRTVSKKENKKIIEDAMVKVVGNFVIVIPNNIAGIRKLILSSEFKDWLKSKNYPNNYNILVVANSPIDGDNVEPGWVIHDLIGHSIYNNSSELNSIDMVFQYEDGMKFLHDKLPNALRNAARDSDDIISDILAGIFLKEIDESDKIEAIAKETVHYNGDIANDRRLILLIIRKFNELFEAPKKWIESISKDGFIVDNKNIYIINQWGVIQP